MSSPPRSLGEPLLDAPFAPLEEQRAARGKSMQSDYPLHARAAPLSKHAVPPDMEESGKRAYVRNLKMLPPVQRRQLDAEPPLARWFRSKSCIYPLMALTLVQVVLLALRQGGRLRGSGFLATQVVVTGVFTIEIVIHAVAVGWRKYLADRHLLYDVFVTTLDWVLIASGYWATGIFVLRLLRVMTLLKVFRTFHLRHSSETAEAVRRNEDGSIIAYNVNNLFAWGFLYNLHGTVLANPEIYVQFLVLAVFTTLYAINLCDSDCSHAFVSALPTAGNGKHCSAWCFSAISASNGFIMASLVSFLLGLFNSLTFSRWWAMRDRLGVVIGRANDISLMYSAYVNGNDERSEWVRRELLRYSSLAHAALYKQTCEDDDWSDLLAAGLCTEKEKRLLEGRPSAYMMVYSWLTELFLQAAESGRVAYPQTVIPLIHANITKQRGAAADVLMYTGCQLPYSYAHIMTLMVKLHLLLISTTCSTFVGFGLERGHWTDVVWGYLLLFTNVLVFQGLLIIHSELVNPMRRGPNHFPEKQYIDFVMSATHAVLGMRHQLPFGPEDMPPLNTPKEWRDNVPPPRHQNELRFRGRSAAPATETVQE